MSIQIAIRIPEDLATALDDMVATGQFDSRADAVRSALVLFLDVERRRRVGETIAEGYRRMPQTAEEIGSAREAAIRSILQDPW